jgi:hypothetical protein
MTFGNANTNLVQLGQEADQANQLGVQPNGPQLEALRQQRLMGVSPSSPVGQQVMSQTMRDWNQHQTELAKTTIATGPANRQIDLVRDQFSKEDRNAYNKTYQDALKRVNAEDAALPLNRRRSEDQKATIAQREADAELRGRQAIMGGPAGVRGSAQAQPGLPVPAPAAGAYPTAPPGGAPMSQRPGDPGALNQQAAVIDNGMKDKLYTLFDAAKNPDGSIDAGKFAAGLSQLPGIVNKGALSDNVGMALKDILANNPAFAQGLRGGLASHYLNVAGTGSKPLVNLEMAGMVGGAAPSDTFLGVGGGGPGVNSPLQAGGVTSLLASAGLSPAANALGITGAAGTGAAAAAPTLTPGAGAAAATWGQTLKGVPGAVLRTTPGKVGAAELAASPVNRVPGEGMLAGANPFNTHLGVWDTMNNEYIAADPRTRNTSLGNWFGTSLPQQQMSQQMLTTALLMRYLRPGQ